MTALLRAEVMKLATLRTTWVLTVIGLGLAALTAGTLYLGPGDPALTGITRTVTAVTLIGNNSIIVLVVALLVMATEFRHRTVGRTFMITPSRIQVLLAKLAVGGAYAGGFFVVSLFVVGALALGTSGDPIVDAEVGRAAWHGLAGLVLTGFLGVAVGALIRSQVVAITLALVWLLVIENLAAALDYRIGRWLPFQALNAVFLGDAAEPIEPGLVGPLPPGIALLVFMGYVVAATAAAVLLMTRRDV